MVSNIPTYFLLNARAFKIVAEFPDTPEGAKAANLFMTDNASVSVLSVSGGRIILADNEDSGQPLKVPLSPVRYKTCACCGAATRGCQWPNQDTGRGLCVDCIDRTGRKMDAREHLFIYGYRGLHFDIPSV